MKKRTGIKGKGTYTYVEVKNRFRSPYHKSVQILVWNGNKTYKKGIKIVIEILIVFRIV